MRPAGENAAPLRALIIQHEEPTPPGLVTEWLDEHGASVETFRIDIDDREIDPSGYDLIVSLGAEGAAFDDSQPFVPREARLMRRAVDADVPVLGLCFGGQMLARVLGGDVYRSTESEIGWLPVRSTEPDLVPEGPWFQWHFDAFTLPPGATLIAESDLGPQAFVAGRSLGLQFHPEVTPEIMDDWVRVYRHELDADGVDPDGLLEETKRRASDSRGMSWQLLERYLSDIARLSSPGGQRGSRSESGVFPRFLDLEYTSIERGEGVWLFTSDGRRILDACSGGAMASCLGHGVPEIVAAAADQAARISYFYNHHFTSEPQERLADRLLEVATPEMARVRFVSGGSEANETALQLARLYHVEQGRPERWRVISPAQAYHGSTMATLALSGRRTLQEPYSPYLASHLHIEPSTWRFDPSGEAALQELDRLLEEAGAETVAAFFCEPVSAAALPGYSPPERFWKGLDERRKEHGFLICFDEVVSGMGRVGSWLAAHQLPIEPDIVAVGKGLGAGYAPLGAVLCRQHVYDAIDQGSREFDLGHTWDGAPLSAAVGLAVLDLLVERGLGGSGPRPGTGPAKRTGSRARGF